MEGLSAEDGIALQAEDAAAVAPDADENQGAAADQNAVQGRMANNAETCFDENSRQTELTAEFQVEP